MTSCPRARSSRRGVPCASRARTSLSARTSSSRCLDRPFSEAVERAGAAAGAFDVAEEEQCDREVGEADEELVADLWEDGRERCSSDECARWMKPVRPI